MLFFCACFWKIAVNFIQKNDRRTLCLDYFEELFDSSIDNILCLFFVRFFCPFLRWMRDIYMETKWAITLWMVDVGYPGRISGPHGRKISLISWQLLLLALFSQHLEASGRNLSYVSHLL